MKKMFFLSFLLISTATHCMETNELDLSKATPKERQNLMRTHCHNVENLQLPYFQENHHLIAEKKQQFKNVYSHGYSALGFAAIAIKVYSAHQAHSFNNEFVFIFEGASYTEKKNLIQKLRHGCGLKPTQKDRELALKIESEAGIELADGKSDLLD